MGPEKMKRVHSPLFLSQASQGSSEAGGYRSQDRDNRYQYPDDGIEQQREESTH